MLVLLGDYVSHSRNHPNDIKIFTRFLKLLSPLNQYFSQLLAILGNHDIRRTLLTAQIISQLNDAGFNILDTELSTDENGQTKIAPKFSSTPVEIAGKILQIIGTPDLLTCGDFYKGADRFILNETNQSHPSLVVTHNPKALTKLTTLTGRQTGLAVSGHTHFGHLPKRMVPQRWSGEKALGPNFKRLIVPGLGSTQKCNTPLPRPPGCKPEVTVVRIFGEP